MKNTVARTLLILSFALVVVGLVDHNADGQGRVAPPCLQHTDGDGLNDCVDDCRVLPNPISPDARPRSLQSLGPPIRSALAFILRAATAPGAADPAL